MDDRFNRIFAGRRFRRQHHRVGAFENRGGDVGDFRARGHRRIDHRFQHLRRHHHRLAGDAAHARHLFLHAGHLLQRHFDAEIAARHHQRVGEFHDLGEPGHRLRFFDLGHHRGAAARDFLRLGDVLRPLDERQRHPIDAGIERGFQIGAVLLGECGKRNGRIRQAHALAVGQFAGHLDARHHTLGLGLRDREPHLAVVDQQRAPGRDRGENFRMREICACGIARRRVAVEYEACAFLHHRRAAGEGAEPQLRPLQIDQDADRPRGVLFDAADHADQFAHAVLAGVAHIDAEHVGAGLEQLGDHCGVGRGGPQRGDDLGAAQPSHRLPLPAGADGDAKGSRCVAEGERDGSGRTGVCSALSVSCTVQERCSVVSTSKKPVRS